MTRRSGSADLRLHGGYVPRWLADRMTRLGAVISEAIVHEYGRDELLRRLAHEEQLQALQRVDVQVRVLERHASGPTVDALIAKENSDSRACGGRSVFGWAPEPGLVVTIKTRKRAI